MTPAPSRSQLPLVESLLARLWERREGGSPRVHGEFPPVADGLSTVGQWWRKRPANTSMVVGLGPLRIDLGRDS
jgi:hypothetical protein